MKQWYLIRTECWKTFPFLRQRQFSATLGVNFIESHLMKTRSSSKNDLQQIESILKQSGLPFEDCKNHLDKFLVVEDSDKIIGTGGLEVCGEFALLRSIAVVDEHRGKKIGDFIYTQIKTKAVSLGIKELYLLTETAEYYFKNRGFRVINRSLAPKEIKETKQFSSLCSSSATVMKLILS